MGKLKHLPPKAVPSSEAEGSHPKKGLHVEAEAIHIPAPLSAATITDAASPFFKDMFSLPQPSPTAIDNTTAGEIPVIPVTEDAETLDFMLRSIYPVRSPKIKKLSNLRFVFEASRKYQIETFDGVAEESLMGAVEQDPVGVYALACRFGLNEIASKAAPYTLNRPLSEFSDCLQYISGEDYWRLMKYRHGCAVAAREVVKTQSWFTECIPTLRLGASDSLCRCYVTDETLANSSSPSWRAPQFLSMVTGDKSFESHWISVKCRCGISHGPGKYLHDGMPKFRQLLATELHRAIAQTIEKISSTSSTLTSRHRLAFLLSIPQIHNLSPLCPTFYYLASPSFWDGSISLPISNLLSAEDIFCVSVSSASCRTLQARFDETHAVPKSLILRDHERTLLCNVFPNPSFPFLETGLEFFPPTTWAIRQNLSLDVSPF
ncbi:hypothetical protein EW146_g5609 [Bondarzewia mesenterica]|uniref:BTB domain-containing protein n=1 Tax=Bondarzewia mesenterica TaxID=1095465 RepID=A0A4S4LQY1_9AGAM|nr:hypothetical protein EW146_g5609 [Bondarzewia mesenterica]